MIHFIIFWPVKFCSFVNVWYRSYIFLEKISSTLPPPTRSVVHERLETAPSELSAQCACGAWLILHLIVFETTAEQDQAIIIFQF